MDIQFESRIEDPFIGIMYTDHVDEDMNYLGKLLEIGFLIFSIQISFK